VIKLMLVDGEPRETAGEGEPWRSFWSAPRSMPKPEARFGDSGVIDSAEGRAIITRAFFTPAGQIVHEGLVESGSLARDTVVTARVDSSCRRGICRSHTATHLLHRALKELLGEHASQAGSLVTSDRLRFDFTHFSALSPEQRRRLEEHVNRKILENLPVTAEKMTLSEAQRRGAVALFAEKYERDAVRVISAGSYSKELCAGTHVGGDRGDRFLRIISEEGSARECAASRHLRVWKHIAMPPPRGLCLKS